MSSEESKTHDSDEEVYQMFVDYVDMCLGYDKVNVEKLCERCGGYVIETMKKDEELELDKFCLECRID